MTVAAGAVLLSRMRHADPGTREEFIEALERAVSARRGARFAARNHQVLQRLEASFASRLRRAFDELGVTVASIANAHGGLTVTRVQESFTSDERRSVDEIVKAADLDRWGRRHLLPLYEEQWLIAGQRTVSVANAQLNAGIRLADNLGARIAAIGGKRLGLLDLRAEARSALYRTIATARQEQLGPVQIAKLIRDEVPAGRFVNAGSRYRAQLIARSETLTASRLSTFHVYREAETVRALLGHDNLTGYNDPDCIERDGKEHSFEEAEEAMNETHPQCTLNWSPVIA